MASIRVAGLDVTDVPDSVAIDVLLIARKHAEAGTVSSVSVRLLDETVVAFLVGAGIPIAVHLDHANDDDFAARGLNVDVRDR